MPEPSTPTEPTAQVRFALVGCGRIALSHLEALTRLPEARLAAVVDIPEGRAAAEVLAQQYACPFYSNYEHPDIVDKSDAVIICTPPNCHFDIASHFLARSRHVLCEKPLTTSSIQAKQLVDLARSSGMTLMMASKFRYVDDIAKAKAIIASGILGKLLLYENSFCSKVAMKDRWNARKAISGGGVLIDNGSHSVDIARYLLGPIKEIQAQYAPSGQAVEVEDTAVLLFQTTGGVLGRVELSWSINKESDAYISVFGTEGTLLIGWKGSKYRQNGNSSWIAFGNGYNKVAAFQKQLENFIGCIRGREQPIITPEDALASVHVIEAAYQSSAPPHASRGCT